MKSFLPKIKYVLLPLAVSVLSGCVYGPLYPWAACPANGPPLIGCYYTGPGPCTAYHPNSFYRCRNNRCTTYSPYAPNKCDPVPYYTGCKYTACCQQAYTSYF